MILLIIIKNKIFLKNIFFCSKIFLKFYDSNIIYILCYNEFVKSSFNNILFFK